MPVVIWIFAGVPGAALCKWRWPAGRGWRLPLRVPVVNSRTADWGQVPSEMAVSGVSSAGMVLVNLHAAATAADPLRLNHLRGRVVGALGGGRTPHARDFHCGRAVGALGVVFYVSGKLWDVLGKLLEAQSVVFYVSGRLWEAQPVVSYVFGSLWEA